MVASEIAKHHLRRYFLFNYDNDFRTMVDNNLIGLRIAEKDLSIVFNTNGSKHEFEKILDEVPNLTVDKKNSLERLLFDMEIGDAVALVDSKSIWAIGIIESNYQYNRNKELPHARKVKWLSKNIIRAEDGNHRIKIREVEKEETYEIIEDVINEALVNSGDNGLLINYPSRITVNRYLTFFKKVQFNPHEIELLNLIYQKQPKGISIFELQKQFETIDVEESIEMLSRKISRRFNLGEVEGKYSPNLFNGVLRDGHLCLILKKELATALVDSEIVDDSIIMDDTKYTIKNAVKNTIYPKKWFDDALELLKLKGSLQIIGPWGTGKSYFARRLAFLLIGTRDMDSVLQIKMHPSLTYEELLMEGTNRTLYRFIEKARKNTMDNFVIVLEDCHEVNMSEVIGEIGYLLEDNNRNREAALDVSFDDKKYYIPKNVYVLTIYRESPDLFDPYVLSNVLTFETRVLFNKKFINMFEDIELGTWIAKTYTEINKILIKYNFSINHGLFLKSDRGVHLDEYQVVVKYKIEPILKRLVDKEDRDIIVKMIDRT